MFTANGERIAHHHNDPYLNHQQDGGKELLGSLLSPFLNKDAHCTSIREVLDAVAEGRMTVESAKAEIERIEHSRGVYVIARPVEVTAEGLHNACDRLEIALNDFTRAVDQACKKLDDTLRRLS